MQRYPDRKLTISDCLGDTVRFEDLARTAWQSQTDVIRQAFILCALFVDLGRRAIFVDGHINPHLKRRALEHGGGMKQFLNKRFRDCGYAYRRMIAFDTVTTNRMGRRGSGRARLHFHGAFEVPEGWSQADLLRVLQRVFGVASMDGRDMGRRQFHASSPDWEQHHSHNGAKASGPLGKFLYAVEHAGTTYKDLELNDGKRSRKAPAIRGRYNRKAARLAQGIPSNFTAEIVFIDSASKRAGQKEFEAWVKIERELLHPKREPSPSKERSVA